MDTDIGAPGVRARWFAWLLGAAVLAAVVVATLHASEGEAFVALVRGANPSWLLCALLLQVCTYAAQGGIWRTVGRSAGAELSRRHAFELSLAKLFVDQTIPSAGLSSSILMAKALEQRGWPLPAIKASVLINAVSYNLAYAVALVIALALLAGLGPLNRLVLGAALLFLVGSIGLSALFLVLPGRDAAPAAKRLRRFPPLAGLFAFVAGASPAQTRSVPVLTAAIALQGAIIVFDAGTLWALIRAVGVTAPIGAVFVSFVLASLVRTMGVVPGGLGTFEATSVVALQATGVDLAAGLSATLLFRGLTFWLPMLPGYWSSRRALGQQPRVAPAGPSAYWSLPPEELWRQLRSSRDGLSSEDAGARLRANGPNAIREHRRRSRLRTLGGQLRSPLLLLLVFAAAASALTGEWVDAGIVLAIVAATAGIGSSREYSAHAVAAALSAQVRIRSSVLRDGRAETVAVEDLVPGDVVLLSAGSLIPGDGVLVEATDLFVSEAVLTGESFPVQKRPGTTPADAPLAARTNSLFMGTSVRSGTARCVIVRTGLATEFGRIADRLTLRPPETEFDRGIRRFGYLLTSAMLLMVLLVFVAHMFRGRPPVETLLFAVALAVGLSPELLPAILAVNLARGARMMARHGVLVRRLNAIENLGSMDVLCTDKTGTLTEGVVKLDGAFGADGAPSPEVLALAVCNAACETGVASPLDEAILRGRATPDAQIQKVAEIPFDFLRKRVTVVVRSGEGVRLITKGAFRQVLEICTRSADGTALDSTRIAELEQRYEQWSRQGIRVLAIAETGIAHKDTYSRDDERALRFVGFVTFLDHPKPDVAHALAGLAALGVSVKLITGDNRFVAQHIATAVGMPATRMVTGRELDDLHDEALWHAAERTDLFVEVDPNQKERIILSLKKMGHVVGFLGDGVNDAPAMHAADTSLSVEQAVDVAREAADFVLLKPSLDVIRRGVEEGRRTFANTLKYILTTTSANLGNMVSMAAASLFLPFLPLTAGQILLNNILSDIPAVGLADDNVDPELVAEPRRWDIRFLGRFMIVFGVVSSVFDVLMFGVLQRLFHADPETFRTGWFVESLLTELVVALVVRTRRPFFRSRPGRLLLLATIGLVPITVALPFTPLGRLLGFVAVSPALLLAIAAVTLLYVAATELVKRRFYRLAPDAPQ